MESVQKLGKFTIIERNWGIADRFPNYEIEINKHLRKYPKLRNGIIFHEIEHTEEDGFNVKDFVHDLAVQNQYSQWELIKFCARHPLSLFQAMPIYYTRRRGLVVDLNMLLINLVMIGLIGGAIWLGFGL